MMDQKDIEELAAIFIEKLDESIREWLAKNEPSWDLMADVDRDLLVANLSMRGIAYQLNQGLGP